MPTTQFQGESAWDAIVNDNSLDIEEERQFLDWVIAAGKSKESSLEELEAEFEIWKHYDGSYGGWDE